MMLSIVRFADSINNRISGPSVANYDLLLTQSEIGLPDTYMITYKEKKKEIKYPEKVKIVEVLLEQSKEVLARMPLQPHFKTINRALDIAKYLKEKVIVVAVSGKYSPQAEQFSCLLKTNYKKNCKLVIEGHGSEVCGYQFLEFKNLYGNIYKKADLVIIMETPFAKLRFKENGFPIDNMAVCPTVVRWEDKINKIEENREILEKIKRKYFRKYKIPFNAEYIITIGRFQKEKGHKYLIKAFKKLQKDYPNLYLLLGGSEKGTINEIKKLIKSNDRIKIIGKVPFTDFHSLIANSIAFVIPSIEIWKGKKLYFAETGPRTIVEALAAGIVGKNVVIASNSGGTPWKFNMEDWLEKQIKIGYEVIEKPFYKQILNGIYNANNRGLLIEQKNEKAIEEAIRIIIEDEKFAKKLNLEGRKYVKNWYSSIKIAKIYNNLLNYIIS